MVWFDPFAEVENLLRPFEGGGRRSAGMPIEAYRRGDEYLVHLDLPGVDRGSIDLTVERNVLRVTAERKSAYEEGDELLLAEGARGTMTRTLYLGQDLDTDRIAAQYIDGVLSLRIPVAERAKPHRIPVGTGTGQRELASAAA
jgi:HSP20 family protein